jgi:selenocysteine-specific elongation factor
VLGAPGLDFETWETTKLEMSFVILSEVEASAVALSSLRSHTMPQSPRTLVIATAGHIDHGKTALVRALTGIDPDRLPEEKRRGITIDLGFASMELQQADGAPLRISFVDIPGHALFIRNMLAGAGCVPAVLFVVAADEGIKPQTIEHLDLCELLGIDHGIIAITKSDVVGREHLDQTTGNVHALAAGTFLREAPVLPVSARTGEGLERLRDELVGLSLRIQAADSSAFPRLPIDRAFVMKGFGTVVTGTLLSGTIHEGQTLTLEPCARPVRVRGLQTHGKPEREAHAGTRVAANLSGIEFSDVRRGQTLVAPDTLTAVSIVDAEIRLLAGAPPLKHGARVHFHAFTSEAMAHVSLYGYESVRPGTARMARLKLDQPVVLAPGDRFVLRQPAPVATIGGGRVLDCDPQPRQRKAATLAWLEQIGNASLPDQLVLRINRRRVAGIRLPALARESGLTPEAVRHHLEPAISSGVISGLDGEMLMSREAVLQMQGESLSNRKSREPSSPQSEHLAEIAQAYEMAGLAAPLVPELAQRFRLGDAEIRRLITLLQRQKTIVRMGSDDLFMHARALDELAARLAPLRGKLIDVSGFKQLTGLSRKYAIPLLEYLDRTRITRKQGDQRLVL